MSQDRFQLRGANPVVLARGQVVEGFLEILEGGAHLLQGPGIPARRLEPRNSGKLGQVFPAVSDHEQSRPMVRSRDKTEIFGSPAKQRGDLIQPGQGSPGYLGRIIAGLGQGVIQADKGNLEIQGRVVTPGFGRLQFQQDARDAGTQQLSIQALLEPLLGIQRRVELPLKFLQYGNALLDFLGTQLLHSVQEFIGGEGSGKRMEFIPGTHDREAARQLAEVIGSQGL